jgi:hypothetical protein
MSEARNPKLEFRKCHETQNPRRTDGSVWHAQRLCDGRGCGFAMASPFEDTQGMPPSWQFEREIEAFPGKAWGRRYKDETST